MSGGTNWWFTYREKMNKFIGKRKILGPTDGITNYIAGWKLTLESDGNVLLTQSAVLNH